MGFGFVGQLTDIHTAQKNPLLVERNEIDSTYGLQTYVYLKGVANTVLGSWVKYDELGVTALLDTDDNPNQGEVAVALAAVVAGDFGWYHRVGRASALCLVNFADEGLVYASATGGSVDDAEVGSAISRVDGAYGRGARDATTGLAIFQINRPRVSAIVID